MSQNKEFTMKKENPTRKSPEKSGEKGARTPAPEQGSPHVDEGAVTDGAAEQVEKGKEKKVNPLAPPINIQGGS